MGHTCLHEGGAKGRQGGQAGGAPYWGGEWGTHACMRGGAKGRQGGQAGGTPYWGGEWGTHACMRGVPRAGRGGRQGGHHIGGVSGAHMPA